MLKGVRTSILLAIVAALLLGYIVLVDRGAVTSGELELHKGSAVPEFVRARAARIEIQRKGATTVLARNPNDLDEGGLWQVEAPYRSKADSEVVDTLLGALEYINAHRRLERVSPADRKRFGFDAPRYRLAVTVGKTRIPILVGNESPLGDGVYLQTADRSVAFVVGKDLIEALDRDASDYHAKELHDGVLVSTTLELSLNDAQGERSVKRQDAELWKLATPDLGLASTPAVTEVINAFDALRAKHFVEQGAKDLSRYGLDQPQFELKLRKTKLLLAAEGKPSESADGKPKREEVTVRLRVGSACRGHVGESYASIDQTGIVYCLLDSDLAKLRKSRDDLREGRLLPLEDDQIQSVRLEQSGRRLALNKANDVWSYEASRSGAVALKGEARAGSVTAWFKALRDTKAERFETSSAAGALRADSIALHIERGKDKTPYDVRIDGSRVDDAVAQRGSEAQSLVMASNALDLLQPAAARFRQLSLLQLDEASLRAIDVRRGSEIERLNRNSSEVTFSVEAPLHAPADGPTMSELSRLFCSLEAVRFAADARAPTFGLDTPAISVVVERDKKDTQAKRITLRIGAVTEDGRYAELEGVPGVFVVSAQLVQQVAEPLVSRTSLSTPMERILALEFKQGSRHWGIARQGEGFVATGNPSVDAKTATEWVEWVATLRASHVTGYGPASREQGMQDPRARLSVTAKANGGGESGHYDILIGAEAPVGGSYARRDDLAVGFVLPKQATDRLLAGLATK